jgi:hypothetical protein
MEQLECLIDPLESAGIKVEIPIKKAIELCKSIAEEKSKTTCDGLVLSYDKEIKELHCKIKDLKESHNQDIDKLNKILSDTTEELRLAKTPIHSPKSDKFKKFFELIRNAVIVRGEDIGVETINDLIDELELDKEDK